MKRMSRSPSPVRMAATSPLRSSAGPAAERRPTPSSSRTMKARLVLPRPGGPISSRWSSASPRDRVASSAIASCSLTRSWPTNSSSERGRSERSSSSSSGRTAGARNCASVSVSVMRPSRPGGPVPPAATRDPSRRAPPRPRSATSRARRARRGRPRAACRRSESARPSSRASPSAPARRAARSSCRSRGWPRTAPCRRARSRAGGRRVASRRRSPARPSGRCRRRRAGARTARARRPRRSRRAGARPPERAGGCRASPPPRPQRDLPPLASPPARSRRRRRRAQSARRCARPRSRAVARSSDRFHQRRRHRVADRDRQRVGCVVRRRHRLQAEDRRHHPLHLRLLGAAVAADGLLDGRGRVLSALEPERGGRDEHGAARLPDGERGAVVDADERLLEDDRTRRVLLDQLDHAVENRLEPNLRTLAGGGLPPPEVDRLEAVSSFADYPEAACRRPWIDAENRHGDTLGTASDTPALGSAVAMELRIEPASDEVHAQLRAWRYAPPYDFYDGDVDPLLNPERFFAALDEEGELVGFYYFEERPPDLDYGLGLRPDLVGRRLGLDFFLAGLEFARERYGPGGVFLHVAEFNERARKVYEQAGFVVVSRHVRSFDRFGDVAFLTMAEH